MHKGIILTLIAQPTHGKKAPISILQTKTQKYLNFHSVQESKQHDEDFDSTTFTEDVPN